MKKGIVYWITGLAGSGKTTIGNALYYKIRKKSTVVLLDGDILKNIINGEGSIGYTKGERLQRAKRYSLLCKMLSSQGINVIICTISMFNEIREWNRNNFEYYVEVFLDVSMEVLKSRDKRGMYQSTNSQDELPGLHYEAEFPQDPDIILNTDGSIPVQECIERILNTSYRQKDSYNKDLLYWNEYYQQKPLALSESSSFAKEMLKMIGESNKKIEGKYLLDLGCGNGRDSIFFAENGVHVVGIDASNVAIEMLEQEHAGNKYLEFVCDDFVTAEALFQKEYDYCYSRFTLHAISEKQEEQLINNVYKALKKNGLFMIEARTIHDRIFGLGEKVEENAYIYDNHYRRFIDPEKLIDKAINKGFKVLYNQEKDGFSKTETDDPVLLRLILQK